MCKSNVSLDSQWLEGLRNKGREFVRAHVITMVQDSTSTEAYRTKWHGWKIITKRIASGDGAFGKGHQE